MRSQRALHGPNVLAKSLLGKTNHEQYPKFFVKETMTRPPLLNAWSVSSISSICFANIQTRVPASTSIRELPNYKSQPKPAQSMDQVLTLLHTEFSKRSTLEEAMMREMSESAQKSQRDCLKLLTRLRSASIDNAERDHYTQPVAERNRYTKLRTECCFKPCAPPDSARLNRFLACLARRSGPAAGGGSRACADR